MLVQDNSMIDEFLKEVATLENIEDAMSEHVLLWACMLVALRMQKSELNNIKEAKAFDTFRCSMQMCDQRTIPHA